jgi:CPA2 family monovalent cation:H+ antiporter-2
VQVLVVTAIATITVNPLLFRMLEPLSRYLSPVRSAARAPSSLEDVASDYQAVVVGFGPIGRAVARQLAEAEARVTVIELNIDAARQIEAAGYRAVHGDVAQRGILETAGIERSQSLVLSAPGLPLAALIRQARELNPRIRIVARASFATDVEAMRKLGADHVVAEEIEVGIAMSEQLLLGLGATPEQLDHARERARLVADFYQEPSR